MRKNKCLYCYKELHEDEKDYHALCSMKFFGSSQAPVMPYCRSNISELAKSVIRTSISVTGVQAKMSLDVDKGSKNKPSKFTIVGLWGKYIFKPESSKYRFLPQLEDLTMKMAEVTGISTVPHSLIRLPDGELGYITKRIDRTDTGTAKSVLDMCQLSNRLTEHKYDGTYVQLANTIQKYSRMPLLDIQKFWEIVIFSWITGNSDMHCKNFSLIDEGQTGAYRLAPAYDLLPVLLVDKEDNEEMAMTFKIGGKKNGFNRSTFVEAMKESGIQENISNKIINKLCSNFEKWKVLINESFLEESIQNEYQELLKKRLTLLEL